MATKIDIPEGLKSSRKEAEKVIQNIEYEINSMKLLNASLDNYQSNKIDKLFTEVESAVILNNL